MIYIYTYISNIFGLTPNLFSRLKMLNSLYKNLYFVYKCQNYELNERKL